MKSIIFILAIVVATASIPAVAQRQQIGPVVVDGFRELVLAKDQVTLTGPRVYVRTDDGKFEAKAEKIIIRFAPGGAQAGFGSLRNATLTGDVWILSKPEPNRSTEARSTRAEIDWAGARQAVLSGNVNVKSTDPTAFAGPLTLTADKAFVNLKPESQLKPGETRIRVESEPEKSRLEFTPLPPKETGEQQ